MKRLLTLCLAAALLAACGAPASSPEADSATSTASTQEAAPTTAPTPEPTPEATPTPEPTVAPVTLDSWRSAGQNPAAEYSITDSTYDSGLLEGAAWPESVTLLANWNGSLEEMAETFGVPVETLQQLNPTPETVDDGNGGTWYFDMQIQDGPYTLPQTALKRVEIVVPWASDPGEQSHSVIVPASLDDQAAAALAEAEWFLYHSEVSVGYWPAEVTDETNMVYRSKEGARFTTFSGFTTFLQSVFTDEKAQAYAGGGLNEYGYYSGFFAGEDDSLCFASGDRGTNIYYAGTAYTEPETLEDGSIRFLQLSLQVSEEGFTGWGTGEEIQPALAYATEVRLVPTEGGWRVAALSLPQ